MHGTRQQLYCSALGEIVWEAAHSLINVKIKDTNMHTVLSYTLDSEHSMYELPTIKTLATHSQQNHFFWNLEPN